MDGYAILGRESFGASDYDPIQFTIIGESLPGRPFHGEVTAGTAVRIMTGAPLPAAADAVVMAEVCKSDQNKLWVHEPVAPQKNVGCRWRRYSTRKSCTRIRPLFAAAGCRPTVLVGYF